MRCGLAAIAPFGILPMEVQTSKRCAREGGGNFPTWTRREPAQFSPKECPWATECFHQKFLSFCCATQGKTSVSMMKASYWLAGIGRASGCAGMLAGGPGFLRAGVCGCVPACRVCLFACLRASLSKTPASYSFFHHI